ncbi:hypothetical protein LIA77_09842 [Sarocladium implicatum]|jgi:hypothetical protein|nr:hypothetical protein LIA77_09842 [Sarocladium implicatum]
MGNPSSLWRWHLGRRGILTEYRGLLPLLPLQIAALVVGPVSIEATLISAVNRLDDAPRCRSVLASSDSRHFQDALTPHDAEPDPWKPVLQVVTRPHPTFAVHPELCWATSSVRLYRRASCGVRRY